MEDILYTDSLEGVQESNLGGFFVRWQTAPSAAKHLELLHGSDKVFLAKTADGKVIGFITAITDNTVSAYIPLLEVLPDFQKEGIGKELVSRMLRALSNFYMVDVVCDPELLPFYESCGMHVGSAASIRNYRTLSSL